MLGADGRVGRAGPDRRVGTLGPVPTPVTSSVTLALGPEWLTPDSLLSTFGLAGILLIVFVESGLLVGFFLPGDSLLFIGGLFSSQGRLAPLWVLLLLVPVAAILGDQLGYYIGRKAGPALFERDDSRLFKQKYVDEAHEFFLRHGGKAVLLARFVPVVRTFTPVTAGVARMPYRSFLVWNVAGGILWGAGVTLLGYFLGQIDFVANNVEAILLLVVVLSVLPIVVQAVRVRRGRTRNAR